MRILLLGEFSGLHKNLQIGLRGAGHHVDLVSSGDGFKAFYGDIAPPRLDKFYPWDKLKYRFDYYQFLRKFSDYDIVQLVNVNVLPRKYFPYARVLNLLKKNNGKIFLLGAGSDSIYWQRSRSFMSYGPFEDVLRYDLKSLNSPLESTKSLEFNEFIAKNVNGIIPIAYDYAIGYEGYSNIRKVVPLPIDVNSIKFRENKSREKLKVFHGLNRYGFKGTRHVEKAFNSLNESRKDQIHCSIKGRLPINNYLNLLQENNVIVDQVNSYSYGMNAIYAAAMGRIVLSGAEPECLEYLNVKDCPIINVKPNPEDIEQKILRILAGEIDLREWSEMSRKYIEDVHCCYLVAEKYIEFWS